MTADQTLALSLLGAVFGGLALARTLPMTPAERHEYAFFLAEYKEKLGREPGAGAKLASWNAVKGGRAPKWHWIPRSDGQSSHIEKAA